MSAPVVYGGLGVAGRLGVGGPQPPLPAAVPAMAKVALPYIAHLYDHNLRFKRTLGGVGLAPTLLNKPSLKQTQNGGHQPIALELATSLPAGDNLLVNPSFEPTVATGAVWALYNNGPEAATLADNSASPFDGVNYARVNWLVANTTTKGLTYSPASLPLFKPFTTYTFSFWARAQGGAVGQPMGLVWNTAPTAVVAIQNPNLTTFWQRYIWQVTWGVAVDVKIFLSVNPNVGYAAGTLDVDMAQLVQGALGSLQGIVLGDVIRLAELGDNAGTILFSGNIDSTPKEEGPNGTHHLITVTPWIAELARAFFNRNYSTATDVAQFVRDAAAATAHCSVTPVSCPDTGVKAMYDFQNTNGLDAVHVAKQIAGSNYFYGVDAQGVVWFQPVALSSPPTLTLRKGVDYNRSKPVATIEGMFNSIPVIGGNNPGDTGKLKSKYDGLTSQGLYGVRTFNPTPSYPTVTDQPTLDAIAASLGAQYDRVQHRVELELPALGLRLSPYRPGGLTVRLWEPAVEALEESAEPGMGGYSATFMLQDVECLGPVQLVVMGDVPYVDIDTSYEAMRIAQRIGVVAPTAIPTPPVAPPATPPPPPPPTQVNQLYNFSCAAGIYAIGGGIVTIGAVTFTTPRAGTCQFLGQVDARMEAWDNYVGAPRRDVWGQIDGIVANGHQELPFGIARQVWTSNSASGIALPAGTYTARWQIQTVGYNQMHIYSGWGQVSWVG